MKKFIKTLLVFAFVLAYPLSTYALDEVESSNEEAKEETTQEQTTETTNNEQKETTTNEQKEKTTNEETTSTTEEEAQEPAKNEKTDSPKTSSESTENNENSKSTDETIDTSKSKTATNLDENYESTVTISIPSAEKENYTDVVYVLDKSTSDDNEQAILNELSKLKDQIKNSNAKVKVGIVIFNKVANIELPLTELNDENYSTIETAIKTKRSSGTNLHAGILAGNKMLAEDTECDNDRKHLVVVSDGVTYIYNEEGDATYTSHEGNNIFASPDDWNQNSVPNGDSEWTSYMEEVKNQIDSEEVNNDVLYGTKKEDINPSLVVDYKDKTRASTVDKALYYSYEAILDSTKSSKVYVIPNKPNNNNGFPYTWGNKYMQFLSNLTGNAGYDYSDITKSIYYFVDAGSVLVDEIGSGDDYNFDFVNDINKLHLYVNGEEVSASKVNDTTYSFGNDRYVLSYYADGYTKDDTNYNECYVLAINEAISIANTVEFKYNVKLTNPKTETGTYGQYDANGENGYDSLLTNNIAVLYPVDSEGNSLEPEEFPKPTVSYTVEDNNTGDEDPKGNVIAKYVDIDTLEEIESREETSGMVGKDYSTFKKDIANYEYVTVDGEVTGTYKDGTIYVTYFYTKNIGDEGEKEDVITPPHTDAVDSFGEQLVYLDDRKYKNRKDF